MRQYGSKKPSQAHNRAVVVSILAMRPTLAGIDPAGLARSYGIPLPEIEAMLAKEKARRAA